MKIDFKMPFYGNITFKIGDTMRGDTDTFHFKQDSDCVELKASTEQLQSYQVLK